MDGQQLKEWRQDKRLTQEQVAEFVTETLQLDDPLTANRLSKVESGKQELPSEVDAFLDNLVSSEDPSVELGVEMPKGKKGRRRRKAEDSIPPPPEGQEALPLAGGLAYAQACEELWGIIALGFTGAGMALGSQALVADGAIIDEDKARLGEAWGKAAEQNATLRRWISTISEGGVWLQVAVVSSQTAGRMYRSHLAYAAAAQNEPNIGNYAPDGGHAPRQPSEPEPSPWSTDSA